MEGVGVSRGVRPAESTVRALLAKLGHSKREFLGSGECGRSTWNTLRRIMTKITHLTLLKPRRNGYRLQPDSRLTTTLNRKDVCA
jgi:hypothetical protein